ncbi:MAG TPA: hypothetical protein VFE20_00280 [Thermoleophilia bacterium]|nr:hypothetical protein [Thermoleophilia bacterium]
MAASVDRGRFGTFRLPFLALILLTLLIGAVAASGCGGGAEAQETTTTLAAAAAPAEPAVEVIPHEELAGSYLELNEETPPEVQEAFEQGQPMVILFYVSGGEDDMRVRESVDAVATDYPEIRFLSYDFKDPESYGNLGRKLRVDYPPQLMFINDEGLINKVISGYVDQGTLFQSVANIS